MNRDHIEIFLTVAGIAINLCGFIFVIRQIKQQALATRGETYTSLCGLSFEILKMIADRPYLYPYFYERKILREGEVSSEIRLEVLMCCEMIANYCDNTMTQKENMPFGVYRKWHKFIEQQISMSPVLLNFLIQYSEWYDPDIGNICKRNVCCPGGLNSTH